MSAYHLAKLSIRLFIYSFIHLLVVYKRVQISSKCAQTDEKYVKYFPRWRITIDSFSSIREAIRVFVDIMDWSPWS